MRLVVTTCVLVACWGLGAAQEKKDEKYTDAQGKFAIQLPVGAKDPKREMKKAKDGSTMTAVVAEGDKGKTCVVIYMDVPALKTTPPKVFFESAIKTLEKSGNEKVQDAKDVQVGTDKLPGHDFLVVGKDGRKVKTRLVVNETRAYTIMVTDGKDFGGTKEADDLIASFEIK
jgi:hypothetical protein